MYSVCDFEQCTCLEVTQVTEVGGFCKIYRCHDAEQKVDERDRHPMGSKDYHPLQAVCSFSEYSRETLGLVEVCMLLPVWY